SPRRRTCWWPRPPRSMSGKVELPGFSPKMKLPILVGAYAVVCALIYLAFRWELRQPATLPWTALDEAIPFVPAALLVYFLHFPFIFCVLYSLQDRENMNRVGASLL